MQDIRIIRLGQGQAVEARQLFHMMASVFGEDSEVLRDEYLNGLLDRRDFWVIAAVCGDSIVGGLTAHTLPMTRRESFEIFIYDLAVRPDVQRRGIGRRLVSAIREIAGAQGVCELFVVADEDDVHALDFYRAVGGDAAPVTMFSFSAVRSDGPFLSR